MNYIMNKALHVFPLLIGLAFFSGCTIQEALLNRLGENSMPGETVINFPSETSLRMTIESFGKMVFQLGEE